MPVFGTWPPIDGGGGGGDDATYLLVAGSGAVVNYQAGSNPAIAPAVTRTGDGLFEVTLTAAGQAAWVAAALHVLGTSAAVAATGVNLAIDAPAPTVLRVKLTDATGTAVNQSFWLRTQILPAV